jgi:hypothetical protein
MIGMIGMIVLMGLIVACLVSLLWLTVCLALLLFEDVPSTARREDEDMRRPRIDLTGQTFGKLTVLEEMPRDRHGNRYYRVQCACGSPPKVVQMGALKDGRQRSCGCGAREHRAQFKRTFTWLYRTGGRRDPR